MVHLGTAAAMAWRKYIHAYAVSRLGKYATPSDIDIDARRTMRRSFIAGFMACARSAR